MRRTVFPWESVPGPHYLAVDTIQRKPWVAKGGWVIVLALLAGGALTRWKIAYVFAVLYALALIMEKYVAVTERGLEIFHQMQITTNYERWDWKDIYAVTHEPDPRNSSRMILYFTKGERTKRNYYMNDDAREILKLAKKQNTEIRIYDGKAPSTKAAENAKDARAAKSAKKNKR